MNVQATARKLALPVAATSAALVLVWLSTTGSAWLAPSVLIVSGLLLILRRPLIRAIAPYAVGIFLIVASSTTFVSASSTLMSAGLRVAGIAVLVLSGFQGSNRTAPSEGSRQVRSREIRSWLTWVVIAYLLYLSFSMAFHGQWTNFILYGFGVLLLVIVLLATAIAVPYEVMSKGAIAALAIVMALSVAYGWALPSIGIAGGRLRGITDNANSLGFYAFLLGSLALIIVKQTSARILFIALSGGVIVWTSSRASMLALVIVVLSLLFSRRSVTAVLAAVGVVGACIVASLAWPGLSNVGSGLLRTNDSRSLSFDTAIQAFHSSPLIGLGMGNNANEIASSPLRALADGGIGGLVAVVVLWMSLLWFSRQGGIRAVGFACAAIVHSLFEGWLLSPISPFLLIFVLCWWVIARKPSSEEEPSSRMRPASVHDNRRHGVAWRPNLDG